jgi:hypothetical protein
MRRWPLFGLAVVVLVAWNGAGAAAANRWPTRGVAAATSPTGARQFFVRANGAVKEFPEIGFHGSGDVHGDARRLPLAKPITGIAATATGNGYWLAAADGGVFTYGDARFRGSMAGSHLNAPVVGIASTKDGRGYWLVAADGGVFTFGDARFFGSLAGRGLDQPIVGITATRSGRGYRLLARDGGVFTFGDATFWGSLGGTGLTDIIGLAPTPSGNGYWILRAHGGTYKNCAIVICGPVVAGPSVANFGDAQPLPPNFVEPGPYGHGIYYLDFAHDPVVAIVANPVHQGYVILRASVNLAHAGYAGTPCECV